MSGVPPFCGADEHRDDLSARGRHGPASVLSLMVTIAGERMLKPWSRRKRQQEHETVYSFHVRYPPTHNLW